jgi:hypothetical protein
VFFSLCSWCSAIFFSVRGCSLLLGMFMLWIDLFLFQSPLHPLRWWSVAHMVTLASMGLLFILFFLFFFRSACCYVFVFLCLIRDWAGKMVAPVAVWIVLLERALCLLLSSWSCWYVGHFFRVGG